MIVEMFGFSLVMAALLIFALLGLCREVSRVRAAIIRLCHAVEQDRDQDDADCFPSYTLNEGDVELVETHGFFR